MKTVSESTWSFQLIIFFILIFACFLTLILSYSKAYTIKNRMLTIIEKYEGVTDESAKIINSFAKQKSYNTTSKCPEGWYGATDLEGDIELSDGSAKYYYCFNELRTKTGKIYYEVQVFYRFNLPIIGEVGMYRIKGQTKTFVGSLDRKYN